MTRNIDYDILKSADDERNKSDERYALKWVERAMWSGISLLALGAITGITRLIYK